jgi:hypothetical protein
MVDDCKTRLTNLTLLMMGLYLSHSIHLNLMARKLPIRAKKLSLVRRLSRFLDNEAVDVESWYAPWVNWLISSATSGGKLRLVLDTTKVTASQRLLCVGIAYQRRTLPLIWAWVGHHKGHCTVNQQIALLRRLHGLIPEGIEVSLVGDGEFGNVLLLELLDHWGWDYALRQAKNAKVLLAGAEAWCRLDELPVQRGQTRIFQAVLLTHASYKTNLVVVWRSSEKAPLYLASNQSSIKTTWQLYKRRMWIEEMFGDMKGHGFDLERSRLRHAERLNRLMLAVSLVYIWLVSVGRYVLQHHLADEVDRNDRRDLSIFRLGWDFVERRLALNDPIPMCFIPNACSVSGS